MTAKPIPEGFHSVTPYLSIKDAKEAIEFYKHVFGAIELIRLPLQRVKLVMRKFSLAIRT